MVGLDRRVQLVFWRWNAREQIRTARDGMPIFVAAPLPKQRKQKAARLDHKQKEMVARKIDGMVKRDYLEPGHVANTVHFFAVPKGNSDIRVVNQQGCRKGMVANDALLGDKPFVFAANVSHEPGIQMCSFIQSQLVGDHHKRGCVKSSRSMIYSVRMLSLKSDGATLPSIMWMLRRVGRPKTKIMWHHSEYQRMGEDSPSIFQEIAF
jgi:hypothetical protein